MKPFNAAATCPKCQSKKVDVLYCQIPTRWNVAGVSCEHLGGIEHIHRTCTRCNYSWLEGCLDQYTLEQKRQGGPLKPEVAKEEGATKTSRIYAKELAALNDTVQSILKELGVSTVAEAQELIHELKGLQMLSNWNTKNSQGDKT